MAQVLLPPTPASLTLSSAPNRNTVHVGGKELGQKKLKAWCLWPVLARSMNEEAPRSLPLSLLAGRIRMGKVFCCCCCFLMSSPEVGPQSYSFSVLNLHLQMLFVGRRRGVSSEDSRSVRTPRGSAWDCCAAAASDHGKGHWVTVEFKTPPAGPRTPGTEPGTEPCKEVTGLKGSGTLRSAPG